MKTVFHSTYDLDRYPLAATVTRSVVAVAIAASFAAAWITAGPGNGIVPVQDWSTTASVSSVSCARGA